MNEDGLTFAEDDAIRCRCALRYVSAKFKSKEACGTHENKGIGSVGTSDHKFGTSIDKL